MYRESFFSKEIVIVLKMVYGWLFLGRLRYFTYLVAVILEFCRSEETIYVRKGESVILLCNVNPNSWPVWEGPGVNGSAFTTYSDKLTINKHLSNAHKLQILGNISAGEYNMKISNVSSKDEGRYSCQGSSNDDKMPNELYLTLKIKVAPWNITVKNAHTGVLQGKENHRLVLRCSVNSGIPKESIMWYNGSVLLGAGGPGNYALEIVPDRFDHESMCTCIVNSSALRIPLNQSIKLDIKYKPVVIIDKDSPITIVEGQNLTLSCLVDSNPAPTLIYFKTSRNSSLCNLSKSAHTCTVDWININRNNSGINRCRAENDVGNGYTSVEVIVLYPPTINIGRIKGENSLRCNANGNPNNYTFYSWLHQSEFGETIREINHTEVISFCPKDPTIRKYQCNGIYICRVENGVKDVSGNRTQSGKVLVRQKDQPRFVSENNKMQYGHFGRIVSLEVSVYSYPFFHELEVFKNGAICDSAHIHVENTTVEDLIFGKIVHLKGYQIKVHGFELTGTDFTSYEFRIGNTVDYASYTVTLNAAEKPQPPTIKDVAATTASLKIFWTKSFDGGTRQHFVLLYKKNTDVDWRSGGQINESINGDNVHVLEDLESDALYMLRIYARNELGESNCTEPWTIRTLAKEKVTGHVVILAGTILGCVIVITGCVMSVLWFLKKGFQREEEHARENGTDDNSNQVDLAVENSIYQSFGQNQTQQDEQNAIDQRNVLLSNTENETMYHNAENTFPCNEDHMAVENYIYQKQGASGNENVQVNPASRICSRKRNSFATTGNTGISSESTCNENFKIKGKQKSSAVTNDTDSIIQGDHSMNYAEVVFDGRRSSQSIVIRGINDRTIYADIDITAVGTQLPENNQAETVEDDDDDDDFMYIDEIVDYRKSKKM